MRRPGPVLRYPLYVAFLLAGPVRSVVERDVLREHHPHHRRPSATWSVTAASFDAAARRPEWRTLYFHRLRNAGGLPRVMSAVLRRLYSYEKTLHLHCPELGAGLHVRHGFATIVDAASVGQDCLISQQVTVGWSDRGGPPVLGRRVQVHAGAKILGPVTVGDDAVIGANAVVVRDVPPGAVMVGVPARPLPQRPGAASPSTRP